MAEGTYPTRVTRPGSALRPSPGHPAPAVTSAIAPATAATRISASASVMVRGGLRTTVSSRGRTTTPRRRAARITRWPGRGAGAGGGPPLVEQPGQLGRQPPRRSQGVLLLEEPQ